MVYALLVPSGGPDYALRFTTPGGMVDKGVQQGSLSLIDRLVLRRAPGRGVRALARALSVLIVVTTGCSTALGGGRAPSGPEPRSGEAAALPIYQIIDPQTAAAFDLVGLGERVLAEAEVVYFGELHNDSVTHEVQRALLEALGERSESVILSLEMFERDVQPLLDSYLAGEISEAEFLAGSRPWSNYPTDYRPLVELARERGWPVLAANVPRPLAAEVARGGLDTLRALDPAERALVAEEIICPRDGYYERFVEVMGEHPGMDDAMVTRFYEAQCIKDETMAESIVATLSAHPGTLIVHMNGAFHSDFGQGVPERVERRRSGTRALILTALPVADPAAASADREQLEESIPRADILIFTRSPSSEP